MAPKLNECTKCLKKIIGRQHLKCSVCVKSYHIDCTNVTNQRFNLMSKERKCTWRCDVCAKAKDKNKSTSIPNIDITSKDNSYQFEAENRGDEREESFRSTVVYAESEYVTLRQNKKPSSIDIHDNTFDTNRSRESFCSVPDISMRKRDLQIEQLKEEIEEVRAQMRGADHEIEKLLLENSQLKKIIINLESKTRKYKDMYINSMTPTKKNLFQKIINDKSHDTRALEYSYIDLNVRNDNNILVKNDPKPKNNAGRRTSTPIMQNEEQTAIKQQEIKHKGKKNKKEKGTDKTGQANDKIVNKRNNTHNDKQDMKTMTTNLKKNDYNMRINKKLCVLSTNKTNKILPLIVGRPDMFQDVCHYIIPGGGIQELVNNIEGKLDNFTSNDYCALIIGDNDFKTTCDYHKLIALINEKISRLTHTNFVLCLPTYKNGNYTTLFNRRVELFNNLLYLDVITHEYAWILDSNRNISYDFKMFVKRTGMLNNTGMKTVINDLYDLITYIDNNYYYEQMDNNNDKDIEGSSDTDDASGNELFRD